MAWYIDEKATSSQFPIKDGETLGREGSHAFPHMLKMSRNHIKIIIEKDNCFILDLASKNGTMLDGKACAPNMKVQVKDGSILAIGEKIFRFKKADKTQTQQIQSLILDDRKQPQHMTKTGIKPLGLLYGNPDGTPKPVEAPKKKKKIPVLYIAAGLIVLVTGIFILIPS